MAPQHVCRGFFEQVLRVRGEPVCTSCAGITRDFHCARCRHEGHLNADHLCTRCVLHDQLTSLLDDGSGRTRPGLAPLLESLPHAVPELDRSMNWIRATPTCPVTCPA